MNGFEERKQQRKLRFIDNWTVRLEKLESSLDKLASAETNRTESLEQVRREFHQFCGAAGIYDLLPACEAAIAAEARCTALLKQPNALAADDVQFFRGQARLMVGLLRDAYNEDKRMSAPAQPGN